jgi:hypothetical protein
MAARTTTELQRIRYWQGQLLASGDLQTQLLVNEELRRLHNRALHQAHGVAIGLALERDEVTGELKQDAETGNLRLGCGMAYDCAGRELIVGKDREIPPPPELPMTLVIAYDPTSVDGVVLTWKRAQEVNANTEVAIETLIPGKDKNNRDVAKPDPEFRQAVARPLARPRMATGKTIPGETPWQPWRLGGTEVGVKVLIDTSAAGFTRAPHYFAEAVSEKTDPNFVPAWFASIADASTQGFTLQLMLHRITRETLDILDPRAQVAAEPVLGSPVELSESGLFADGDLVARLLPLAQKAAVINALSANGNATLDEPLDDLTEPKQVAFGNAPRLDKVEATAETPSFEITVDDPSKFHEGDVVIKLGDMPGAATPSKIVAIEDTDTIELSPPITGLAAGDMLGVVASGSTVDAVNGVNVTVASVDKFKKNGLAVLLKEPVESSPSVTIVDIDEQAKTLQLSTVLSGLAPGNLLSAASIDGVSDRVLTVTKVPSEMKVTVKNNVKQFRSGDLVGKRFADGTFSTPVRVKEGIKIQAKTLTLSSAIPGLSPDDTIAVANFPVRATVLAQSVTNVGGQPFTLVTVADSSLFSVPRAYVARIDDKLSASLPVPVTRILSDTILELGGEIQGLDRGDVIGLCSFPATVEVVRAAQPDGSIEVNAAGVLREGDLVTALPALTGLALVKKVDNRIVRLVGKIEGLAAGDDLSVANIGGVVNATPGANDNQVKVAEPRRVRQGDFLADITGWRQATPGGNAVSLVLKAEDDQITLTSPLDGLLVNDTIGLASIVPPFIRLRLNTMPDLIHGDEVLLVGLDRLQGETQSLVASVFQIDKPAGRVFLFVQGAAGAATFRPSKEDLSASVLFVRGSALALIQKHDLFVSWLAVGEPDTMPRPCDGADLLDDPCSQLEE